MLDYALSRITRNSSINMITRRRGNILRHFTLNDTKYLNVERTSSAYTGTVNDYLRARLNADE